MNEQTVLEVKDLAKSYGGFRLGPINMALAPGYVYVIMGRNGSGKSTLFRLLTSLSHPQAGALAWFPDWERGGGNTGAPYTASHPADREIHEQREKRRQIAYMPDELDIPDESWSLAVWQDAVSVFYPEWDSALYRRLVERYGLDERKPLGKVSKGGRRLAALVIALAQNPKVLVLDEPSAGLDPFAWKLLLEDLSAFMAKGDRTILMATHIIEEIRRLGDYVLFLEDGKLHGPFEKDTLYDSWRTLWTERLPEDAASLPGVASVESGPPARLVSRSPRQTRGALEELGVRVTDELPLEWDELFWHVIRMKDKNMR